MKPNTLLLIFSLTFFAVGCAHSMPVKTQAYAKLKGERTFENDLPETWKAIEAALKDHKITKRDPDEVDDGDWRGLKGRTLETDWIYSQSRDNYVEYKVNGFPRKKYLQERFKYEVEAMRVVGGTDVEVKLAEEIEKLKDDGSSAGYSPVKDPDTSRAGEFLDKINQALLAAHP
jgi:hypothetical protein